MYNIIRTYRRFSQSTISLEREKRRHVSLHRSRNVLTSYISCIKTVRKRNGNGTDRCVDKPFVKRCLQNGIPLNAHCTETERELFYDAYCMLASQCAQGMGLSNAPWEWDKPMCPGNRSSQCVLGMGLSYVPWEWDYPMYAGKELANVHREWD